MTERPGRRARSSLALSGAIAAVGVVAVGVTVGLLGGGPVWWVTAGIAAVLVLLGLGLGWSGSARRASTTVLVAASDFGGLAVAVCSGLLLMLLVLGRLPRVAEVDLLDAAMIGMLLVATLAGPVGRRFGRFSRAALLGVRRSPDELLADFADRAGRGSPVDDVLRRLAESMRRDWRLSRVEIWSAEPPEGSPDGPGPAGPGLLDGGALHRTLVVPRPDAGAEPDGPPAPLEDEEITMLRRAGVAGPGWLRLWLPRLLAGRGPVADRQLRLAPAVLGGRVLALVVVERAADAEPFTVSDERSLAEVARRLAIVLRNRTLDEALRATLADLRRTNADLQASRTRLVGTADAERRRIERDLHDGAQQHLVALAVGLRLVRDGVGAPTDGTPDLRPMLDELDAGIREAITELRNLAHGIYPPLLRDSGLGEALRAAAKRSPLDVAVTADGIGRHPEQVEAAVYFCCLEALQNAAKHAPGATVAVVLEVAGGELRFTVSDSGPGFDPAGTPAGAGLQNMSDRLGAVGGTVAWHAAPGKGATVAGRVPLAAAVPVEV